MPDEPAWPDQDPQPQASHPTSDQAPAGQALAAQAAAAQAAGGSTARPAAGPTPGWGVPGDFPGDSPGDEDDDWPDDDEAGPPWPPPSGGSGGSARRRRPLGLAMIAVAALVVGAGVTLAVSSELSPSSPAAASPSQSPVVTRPRGSSQLPGGALPGGTGTAQMFIAGRVQAITAASITLGAPGRAVTAAITSATRVSGRVSSAGQIKVGDNVSAQITLRDGKPVVTSMQDPAQLPSGP
jgi:hypothetical protein